MTLQLPESFLRPTSCTPTITLNGVPVCYDAQWLPVVAGGSRVTCLDDLAGEPSTQAPEALPFTEDVPYSEPFGRCRRLQGIGREASAYLASGDYERVLAVLKRVMTPPLARAIASGNPDSVKEHIGRATGYKMH